MAPGGVNRTTAARGRPRTIGDDTVLEAAFDAFAATGFDAMSMRRLCAELGLSHGALHQRFGSKDELFDAALAHGVHKVVESTQIALKEQEVIPDDDLGKLRAEIRALLLSSATHPQVGRLIILTGQVDSERLTTIFDRLTGPHIRRMGRRLQRLVDAGIVRPMTIGQLWFLVAHGGAGPYNAPALARMFATHEPPLDPVTHAELIADIIITGIRARAS